MAGVHVPVIPLLEVVGNGASGAPAQIGGTCVKAGVMADPAVSTVMVAAAVQPFASFTVIVYGPAARPVKTLLAW